jgi:hypothetical protein
MAAEKQAASVNISTRDLPNQWLSSSSRIARSAAPTLIISAVISSSSASLASRLAKVALQAQWHPMVIIAIVLCGFSQVTVHHDRLPRCEKNDAAGSACDVMVVVVVVGAVVGVVIGAAS